MKQSASFPDEPMRVKETTPKLFSPLYHGFFDAWASILSPAEFMVFACVLRIAHFATGESDGLFSSGRCHDLTGLDRKTILKAMSTLRQFGILIVVPRNGQTGFIKINQDVRPKSDMVTKPNKPPRYRREPVPPSGTGPVPPSGMGPVPPSGTTIEIPIDKKERVTVDDDDGKKNTDLADLTEGFLQLGQVLDTRMGYRILEDARRVRPDASVCEILMIARDRLPAVLKSKWVRHPLPYLLRSILECLTGPAFDTFRKRCNELAAEKAREAAELKEIQEWGRLHGYME